MKIGIIDDDPKSIEVLAGKLNAMNGIEVTCTAGTGKAGYEMLLDEKVDLLFLDVQLPDMTGMDVLDMIQKDGSINCGVVIYSTYDEYMLQSFRKNAFDYLLKPVDDDELKLIIDRFAANEEEMKPKSMERIDAEEKILLFLNTTDFRLVHIKDIGLFCYNSNRRLWEVYVAGNKHGFVLKRSVTNAMILGFDSRFVQVHQSFIINLSYLSEVIDNKCHFLPPFDYIDTVKVGRMYRRKLIQRFSRL
jgi:two-component system LytT family response regulator